MMWMNEGNKCVWDLVFQPHLPLILFLSVLTLGESCQFPESERNLKTLSGRSSSCPANVFLPSTISHKSLQGSAGLEVGF